jgi:hypothetical protein
MMAPLEEWRILRLDKVQLVKKVLRRRCESELAPMGRFLASKAKDAAPRQSAIGEKSLVTEMQGRIDLARWLPASIAKAISA